jgi:DNA-binding CsgD family transcriptional regulator
VSSESPAHPSSASPFSASKDLLALDGPSTEAHNRNVRLLERECHLAAGLTPREREVLELICAGQTNDEISGRLFISVKTVDHHVSSVLGKLGVESRKVAATEAVRRGLVPAQ